MHIALSLSQEFITKNYKNKKQSQNLKKWTVICYFPYFFMELDGKKVFNSF